MNGIQPQKNDQPANKIAQGSVYLTSGYITNMLISALSAILIVRYLGPAQFGIFSLGLAIATLSATLTTYAEASLERYIPEFIVKENTDLLKKIYLIISTFKISLAIFVAIGLFLLSTIIGKWYRIEILPPILKILSFYVVAYAISCVVLSALVGLQNYKAIFAFISLQGLSGLLTIILVMWRHYDLIVFTHITAFTYLILAIIYYTRTLVKIHKININSTPNKPGYHRGFYSMLFRYAWPVSISNVINLSYLSFGKIITGYFFSSTILGYFSFARAIIDKFAGLSNYVTASITPTFSKLKVMEDKDMLQKTHFYSFKYCLLLGWWMTVILFVFSKELILLFGGEKYLPAVNIFRIFTGIMFLRLPYLTFWPVYYAYEKTKSAILVQLIAFPLEIILCFMLIAAIGVEGIALSHIIGYMLTLFISFSVVYAFFQFNRYAYLKQIIKVSLLSIPILISSILTERFTLQNLYIIFVFKPILVTFIFIALLYFAQIFTKDDLRRISKINLGSNILDRIKEGGINFINSFFTHLDLISSCVSKYSKKIRQKREFEGVINEKR